MANKSLGTVTAVTSMRKQDSLVIEVDGSIRRIDLDDFLEAINEGQTQLLTTVAWGIPIKDELQTSPVWGMVGNLSAYAAYKAKCGRYLMNASGQAAKLHSNNSGVFADGTTLDETKGSVVVIAPRLYYLYQVDAETSIPYLWMSEQPISKHYLGTAGNGMYNVIGAYCGSLSGGKLVSRSGVDFDTSVKTINGYWSAAQAFGGNWGLVNYDLWRWVCMMSLCESGGNANIQAAIGYGVGGSGGIAWSTVLSSTTLRKCGGTKGLGDATGSVAVTGGNADSTHVSVLGVENFWNCQWQFIQGVFFGSSNNSAQSGTEIFIYEGNRMPSSSELASAPGGSYRQLTRITSPGWIRSVIKGEYFDMLAKSVSGGGSTTTWSDYTYNNTVGQVLLVGAGADNGSWAGPFYANSNNAWSFASSDVGARPAYYGQVLMVDGKDI